MKKALIVIDMQKDFIDGSLENREAQNIVNNVINYIKEAKEQNIDIIYTMDTHTDDYLTTVEGTKLPVVHCIKNTDGWKLAEGIYQGGIIFEKPTFGSTELANYLKDNHYDDLTFIGVCTDICVVSNVILAKAYLPNAHITVIKDLCAGTTISNHNDALTTMANCHIDIK